MSNLEESITAIRVTAEMKERAERAVENGYGSQAEYVRNMWSAGESVVGDLDPRVGGSTQHNTEIDSAEAAAKALDDVVILNQLSNEPQQFEDVIQRLTQQFENVLADRLKEMEYDDKSAVTSDVNGNFWLEE